MVRPRPDIVMIIQRSRDRAGRGGTGTAGAGVAELDCMRAPGCRSEQSEPFHRCGPWPRAAPDGFPLYGFPSGQVIEVLISATVTEIAVIYEMRCTISFRHE